MTNTKALSVFLAFVLTICTNTTAFAAEQASPVSTEDVVITDDSTRQNTDSFERDDNSIDSETPAQEETEDSDHQAADLVEEGTAEQPEEVAQPEEAVRLEAELPEAEQPEADAVDQLDEEQEQPEAEAQPEAVEQPETEEPLEAVEQPDTEEQPEEESDQPAAAKASSADAPADKSGTSDISNSSKNAAEDEHHLAFASDYHNTEGSIQNAMEGMPEDVEYVSLIGDMVGGMGNMKPQYDSQQILDLVKDVFPELDNENVSIVWASHDENVNDEGTGIVKCMNGVSELLREGTNGDNSPAYYVFGIGFYDMTNEKATSADAAAAFKKWVNGINHTIPVIVLCHVPIQTSRADNNGASYWNEALNYAATGVEGITTTDTTADIIRNVLFLHGHNHTNDPVERYFGAGETMSVQVDKSSAPNTDTPRPRPGRKPEGVLSNIYYTSLTAGYLKTSQSATLVTVADGALTLTKYNGGQNVPLGVVGTTNDPAGTSVTIAAQRHIEGQGARENIAEATCEHSGAYDLVVCCTICGEELLRTHVLTDAAGHRWGDWMVIREATETAEGEESRTCSVCGQKESRPIAVLSPEEPENSDSAGKTEDRSPGKFKYPKDRDASPEKPGEESGDSQAAEESQSADQLSGNSGSTDSAGQRKAGAKLRTAASPNTGDQNPWGQWAAIMCLAVIALGTRDLWGSLHDEGGR